MTIASLISVQMGRVAPLGPDGVPSGIVKTPVSGAVRVEALGLIGDEQADLTVHGGPEKAVYAYAASQYPIWSSDFPNHAHQFVAGSMGENLTISGIDEASLCVGDIHAIGTARLQVCQPRQPCFKFALRFNDIKLPNAMVRNGRSGWYYRVVQQGSFRAGDDVVLDARPNPDFAFDRLVGIIFRRSATPEDFVRLADMPEVASWIREYANRRIGRA